jgi:peroxin-5
VKQQDNERESEAIQALRRSVDLDSDYLPSWLALGISHTNESNRSGAYDAIREWVTRQKPYESLTVKLDSHASISATQKERYDELINCLITMARNGENIDADIQVALAVLLNSNEVGNSVAVLFSSHYMTMCNLGVCESHRLFQNGPCCSAKCKRAI